MPRLTLEHARAKEHHARGSTSIRCGRSCRAPRRQSWPQAACPTQSSERRAKSSSTVADVQLVGIISRSLDPRMCRECMPCNHAHSTFTSSHCFFMRSKRDASPALPQLALSIDPPPARVFCSGAGPAERPRIICRFAPPSKRVTGNAARGRSARTGTRRTRGAAVMLHVRGHHLFILIKQLATLPVLPHSLRHRRSAAL